MAQLALRLDTNVPGDFFVDESCIDCDACRIFAPTVFSDEYDQSAVFHQPESEDELLAAQKALISCPTASIGTVAKHDMRAAVAALPELVDGDVYRCGYTSESSFGAVSYLIRRPDGNTLVDSPRFTEPLARNLGNVTRMLLTHRDDVADHEQFHERFGCQRVLHREDVGRSTAGVELQPAGLDPIDLGDGLVMIPTPGHTRGHLSSSIATPTSSPAITWPGARAAAICTRSAAPAGTHGPSRSSRWSGSSTTVSSGSCPATAAPSISRPRRCTLRWSAASSG